MRSTYGSPSATSRSTEAASCISVVPGVPVRAREGHGARLWMVDDGLAGFDYAAGRWMLREQELVQSVRWVLQGPVNLPRYRRVYRGAGGEQRQSGRVSGGRLRSQPRPKPNTIRSTES